MKHSSAKRLTPMESAIQRSRFEGSKEYTRYEEDKQVLKAVKGGDNIDKKVTLAQRLSPFLLLIVLLFILFPYMLISGEGAIRSFWLQLFVFPFLVCNLFYADIAIWKYFSGKKILLIWAVEFAVSALIVKMLL